MMVAVILALAAALSWALSAILVRAGLRYIAAATGTFISLLAGVMFMLVAVTLFQRDDVADLTWDAAAIFAAVGVLSFLIGQFLHVLSIDHLGVIRATPLTTATPFFAAVLAVVVLGETVDGLTVAGASLVMLGTYTVVSQS